MSGEKQLKAEDVQGAYIEQKDRYVIAEYIGLLIVERDTDYLMLSVPPLLSCRTSVPSVSNLG